MLKKYSQFFLSALVLNDGIVVCVSWFFAFQLRFFSGWFNDRMGFPSIEPYSLLIIPILIIYLVSFKISGLYQPLRGKPLRNDIFNILKGTTIATIVFLAILFFYRQQSFSRVVIVLFYFQISLGLILTHLTLRKMLMFFRRRGKNLRNVLIVGTGELAQSLAKKFEVFPEMGFNIVGHITDQPGEIGQTKKSMRILGTLGEISEIVKQNGVDHLYIALPFKSNNRLQNIISKMRNTAVDIKVVPDLMKFMDLRGGVDDFDGLPIINLNESPLYGWNSFFKRLTDIICSVILLIISFPLMLILALLIRLDSKGSIFFIQERVGLDGKSFKIFKFRTMQKEAEKLCGPVWAVEDDIRTTRLGRILRKTSLDELPQLLNVLMGDMSLVGPRPERPIFVEEFKKSIPSYNFRLRMKAGLTGWAQINGWRGNTCIQKRIEHDIYYIQHWSWLFDLKILALTLWKGLFNRHAY